MNSNRRIEVRPNERGSLRDRTGGGGSEAVYPWPWTAWGMSLEDGEWVNARDEREDGDSPEEALSEFLEAYPSWASAPHSLQSGDSTLLICVNCGRAMRTTPFG